ncbi:hypothetical protein M0812_20441 [Anaeramoeba flamelloides]|uniref:Uncharacterized protein n=1 Tax=Anaeramoeba flamelloides TaxID=1746091 RepID=A0AAV7YVT8_9EUKA|nr:hypothetical protein M0812_20441 [Anaeramoeba flamelloides]
MNMKASRFEGGPFFKNEFVDFPFKQTSMCVKRYTQQNGNKREKEIKKEEENEKENKNENENGRLQMKPLINNMLYHKLFENPNKGMFVPKQNQEKSEPRSNHFQHLQSNKYGTLLSLSRGEESCPIQQLPFHFDFLSNREASEQFTLAKIVEHPKTKMRILSVVNTQFRVELNDLQINSGQMIQLKDGDNIKITRKDGGKYSFLFLSELLLSHYYQNKANKNNENKNKNKENKNKENKNKNNNQTNNYCNVGNPKKASVIQFPIISGSNFQTQKQLSLKIVNKIRKYNDLINNIILKEQLKKQNSDHQNNAILKTDIVSSNFTRLIEMNLKLFLQDPKNSPRKSFLKILISGPRHSTYIQQQIVEGLTRKMNLKLITFDFSTLLSSLQNIHYFKKKEQKKMQNKVQKVSDQNKLRVGNYVMYVGPKLKVNEKENFFTVFSKLFSRVNNENRNSEKNINDDLVLKPGLTGKVIMTFGYQDELRSRYVGIEFEKKRKKKIYFVKQTQLLKLHHNFIDQLLPSLICKQFFKHLKKEKKNFVLFIGKIDHILCHSYYLLHYLKRSIDKITKTMPNCFLITSIENHTSQRNTKRPINAFQNYQQQNIFQSNFHFHNYKKILYKFLDFPIILKKPKNIDILKKWNQIFQSHEKQVLQQKNLQLFNLILSQEKYKNLKIKLSKNITSKIFPLKNYSLKEMKNITNNTLTYCFKKSYLSKNKNQTKTEKNVIFIIAPQDLINGINLFEKINNNNANDNLISPFI